jgi:Heterodisulfide reductase, subunit B
MIVVACPLCQSNLDMRQPGVEKLFHVKLNLPVMYFTQLLALAFGHDQKDLMLGKHIVPVEKALAKIGKEPEKKEEIKSKKTVESEEAK